MQPITFENLPAAINGLIKEVRELKFIIQQSKPKEPEELLTRREACELLSVTDVTIWAWAKQGKLKTYKIGNKVMLKRSEILEVITKSITKK
ncbi:helix-turn-helix domain-containing protein [Kaistella polysaccharea]|uniref:helix-turn-helix domain-containing protein n=1 Tax=Kaistella polysaccharea TaxID=2878534 RepID=UPI001CF472A5|nr:helix-turn-helix domain-containing protein [Kaistella polysaccharea]